MGGTALPIDELVRRGSYRPHKHGPIDKTQFFTGNKLQANPPDSLCPYGRCVWERLYPIITAANQVTENERELFVAYCHFAGQVDMALHKIKIEGPFQKRKRKRKGLMDDNEDTQLAVQSKWQVHMNACAKQMATFARLLGLTSIDRLKVIREKTPEEKAKDAAEAAPLTRPLSLFERQNASG